MESSMYFEKRKEVLEVEIQNLEAEFGKLPVGSLQCFKDNDRYKYYNRKPDKQGVMHRYYIPKAEVGTVKELAKKAYLSKVIADKKNELNSINAYLKRRKPNNYIELIQPGSAIKDFLANSSWESASYNKNTKFPEGLVIPTLKGDMVRSKSEALIANYIYELGILYRYECELMLGDIVYYPDFTVKNLRTQKTFLWEHFGKMDDPAYLSKTTGKIKNYIDNGYIPSENLIMTFETKKHPLTIDAVKSVVEEFLM